MSTEYISEWDRFIVRMTDRWAFICSQPGRSADRFVEQWLGVPDNRAQFEGILDENMIDELLEYGTWNLDELSDREDNIKKLVRLAAGNIREEIQEKRPLRTSPE